MAASDPGTPPAATAWQLWHIDTFDRDSRPSLQGSGENILHGLYELWRWTLAEGLVESGSASFSAFYLTWGSPPAARADIAVQPFHNPALRKLRGWLEPDAQKEAVLWKLAQMHYEFLRKSRRLIAPAPDWSAEAREVLMRVEGISGPEELQMLNV